MRDIQPRWRRHFKFLATEPETDPFKFGEGNEPEAEGDGVREMGRGGGGGASRRSGFPACWGGNRHAIIWELPVAGALRRLAASF